MDHIVYIDTQAKELDLLLSGKKTMIIRGAMGRKIPYDRVSIGDDLYFVENKSNGLISSKAEVEKVFFSKMLTHEESFQLVDANQDKLVLNTALKKRFAGKRYISLISIKKVMKLDPSIVFDNSNYQKMDDWLVVGVISNVISRQEV